MSFTKIVVAGSTGMLADHVLAALLNSTDPKFDVTVLTRHDSGKKQASSDVKHIPVNYDNHAALTRAVTGADAIVSLISGAAAVPTNQALFKAAQAAGVRRIFPSEYTLDVLHPAAVSLFTGGEWPTEPPTPVTVARYFEKVAKDGGPTSYTTLMPAAFIDGWLEGTYGTFNPKDRKVDLIDGGDKPFTGATLPFIAACIVAALQMDEEKTKNKRIPIAEVRTTMNDVVKTYENASGAKFETVPVSSQDLLVTRDGALKAGNFAPAYFLSILVGAFGGGGAADLKGGLQFDGDGFLTRKRKTLDELCTDAVKKVEAA